MPLACQNTPDNRATSGHPRTSERRPDLGMPWSQTYLKDLIRKRRMSGVCARRRGSWPGWWAVVVSQAEVVSRARAPGLID